MVTSPVVYENARRYGNRRARPMRPRDRGHRSARRRSDSADRGVSARRWRVRGMADGSAIEWTEATWNPVTGCSKLSPGCAHCYAETFAERFRGVPGHPYEQGFDLRLSPARLEQPLRWRRPRMIFVNSMSDLFREEIPDEFVAA